MSVEVFHGSWKIIECVNITNNRHGSGVSKIEGAVFVLQDNGEIRWELPPEIQEEASFPLFQCDCYEIVHSFVGVSIQMGAVSGGHMLEFWVDRPVPRDLMLLTFESWCMIQCQMISPKQPTMDFPFSFLPALDGYFSDIQISGTDESNKDQYNIHSVIMECSGVDKRTMDELKKLPSDVVRTILYFLYSQSLPHNLSKTTAQICLTTAPKSMEEFKDMCHKYLHRYNLKQRIVKLVNEVHCCADAMKKSFQEYSQANPSRFAHVIRLVLKHSAVAFMKLVELCVLYGEEADNLERNERLEILRYAKTRLPIFLNQFISLLRNIKSEFSTLKPSSRNDIAAHISPEIEIFLSLLANLMKEARDSSNDIWVKWSTNGPTPSGFPGHVPSSSESCASSSASSTGTGSGSGSSPELEIDGLTILTEALDSIFRKREIAKLHNVQGQVASIYLYLAQKKENFEEMTNAVKVRCVSRNLEQLIEELPVFLLRLEEIMIAFDDRFQWKDFKFCLQLAISQVFQTIQHLRKEKERLQKFFGCLIDLVSRDDFYQSFVNLKLIDNASSNGPSSASDSVSSCTNTNGGDEELQTSLKVSRNDLSTSPFMKSKQKRSDSLYYEDMNSSNELNLFENLCTPKRSKESILALNSSKLFDSVSHSDMTFAIAGQDGEMIEIPAHRVIVAARCDWMRRALLSGMKESIQKRIEIHECTASVFHLFLKFIYMGQLSTEEVTLEILSDLIALSDRYEVDSLKLSCEQELAKHHLDENSVIFLLSLADQYNARTLRGSCMEYISSNPDIIGREMFEELCPELQMEVYDITMWSKPNRTKIFAPPDDLLNCPRYMQTRLITDSSSSSSSRSTSPAPASNSKFEVESMPIINSTSTSRSNTSSSSHHHHHHHHHHHRSSNSKSSRSHSHHRHHQSQQQSQSHSSTTKSSSKPK